MDTFGTDLAPHSCVDSSGPGVGSVADDQVPQNYNFVPTSDEGWAALEMRVARKSMLCGAAASIRSLLRSSKAIARIEVHGGEAGTALLAEARAWLKDAIAYEEIHGVDSMLDRNDPWVRDVAIPAKERLLERRRLASARTAARAWVTSPAEKEG